MKFKNHYNISHFILHDINTPSGFYSLGHLFWSKSLSLYQLYLHEGLTLVNTDVIKSFHNSNAILQS